MMIVIEGGDQAGKLTQSTLLEKALKERNIKTKLFHLLQHQHSSDSLQNTQKDSHLGVFLCVLQKFIHQLLSWWYNQYHVQLLQLCLLLDEFEKNEEFLRRISKVYRTTAKRKEKDWKIIDASKPKNKVHEEILQTSLRFKIAMFL